jgi:hypothetical protein
MMLMMIDPAQLAKAKTWLALEMAIVHVHALQKDLAYPKARLEVAEKLVKGISGAVKRLTRIP